MSVALDARPEAAQANPPDWLVRDLRSDQAGETGAVWIYRGVLAVSRDAQVRAFAEHHLETEQRHLDLVNAALPAAKRTRLLWLWRIMGFFTGALPALAGPRAVFATIEAVETFVDRHYQDQIDRLEGREEHADLRDLMIACQADEIAHRDEAAALFEGRKGPLLKTWVGLVGFGSEAAVVVAKRI